MTVRWSKLAPLLALTPATVVTATAFIGAIAWSIYLSFTKSRRFPDYTLEGTRQLHAIEPLPKPAGVS